MNPLVHPDRLGFPLTEEQIAIGEAARQFSLERLLPGALERDEHGTYPLEFFGALAELGLLAMKVHEDDGGSGVDNVAYLMAMAGIAEGCASTAVILASSNLASQILGIHGSPEQRERWLRPYAEGQLGPASFALSEPHCGSDAAALRCAAVRDGDDYVITGSKMWITSGAHAGFHVLFARTGPGNGGISCFVVPRDTPGLIVGKEEDKMGQRASGTVALHLEDCRVPADHRIGEEGRGYSIALSALGGGRVGIAGLCLGLGEAAFAEGLSYAAARKAFGEPVLSFQNSRFTLADCRTELDAAWLMAIRGATLLDRDGRAPMASSMAKLYASEVCDRVVDRMLQLHGGYGYSREYRIERLYRDARVTRIYEGSSEIQRLLIGRSLARHAST